MDAVGADGDEAAGEDADGFAGLAMLSLINLRPELPLALEIAGSAEIALLPEEP